MAIVICRSKAYRGCYLSGRACSNCPWEDCYSLHSKIQFWWIEMKLEPCLFIGICVLVLKISTYYLSFLSNLISLFVYSILNWTRILSRFTSSLWLLDAVRVEPSKELGSTPTSAEGLPCFDSNVVLCIFPLPCLNFLMS